MRYCASKNSNSNSWFQPIVIIGATLWQRFKRPTVKFEVKFLSLDAYPTTVAFWLKFCSNYVEKALNMTGLLIKCVTLCLKVHIPQATFHKQLCLSVEFSKLIFSTVTTLQLRDLWSSPDQITRQKFEIKLCHSHSNLLLTWRHLCNHNCCEQKNH